MQFKKATKAQAKLRLALVGTSGSGKTFTALAIACALGKRVAVVDTERGSASKYAGGQFDFDALDLESFAPQQFIDAIHAASKGGYDVLVIDSLSHAWIGSGGALDQVDNIQKRSQSRNSFTAWREVTPQHNALVDAIIRAPMHVIVTMRAKTEYVIERDERTGKTSPRKVGIQPVQRDGLEYEFDVVADLDGEHNFCVTKTRCAELDGKVFRRAGADVADILRGWLSAGVEPAPPQSATDNGAAHATGLENALRASVDSQWPAFVAAQRAKMLSAATMGQLVAAWADVAEAIKKLSPPSEYVAELRATKDDRKRALNGAAAS